MRSLEWIAGLLPSYSSVFTSGTEAYCDHTVHFSVDLSLRLDSPTFWPRYPDTKVRPPTPSRLFPVPPGIEMGVDKCNLGVISQERLKIDVKLLICANSATSIGITMDDLEWPWMTVSRIARYICGSWASCFRMVIMLIGTYVWYVHLINCLLTCMYKSQQIQTLGIFKVSYSDNEFYRLLVSS